MEAREKGILRIKRVCKEPLLKNLETFRVYESHRWVVPKTKWLVTLAKSKDGAEVVKHPQKSIYGVQFHPEKYIKKTEGHQIIENFLRIPS